MLLWLHNFAQLVRTRGECYNTKPHEMETFEQTFGLDPLLPPSCIQPTTEECLAWVKDSFQPQVLVASRNGLTSQCN